MAILITVITVAVCVAQPVAVVRHPNCTAPGAGVPFKGKHAQKLRLGEQATKDKSTYRKRRERGRE